MSAKPSPEWRFPYPPVQGVLLVVIVGLAGFQAWMVQRNLGILLSQAKAAALPERVSWMLAGLWALVGGLVVFVSGVFVYRGRLRLAFGEGFLLVGSWTGTRRIPDKDVSAIEVYGSLWQGVRVVISHKGGEARFPLLHGRARGEATPKRPSTPEKVKEHPLVQALAERFGWEVLSLRVRR